LQVRERIRINGLPLPTETFAKHFFTVWDRLDQTTNTTTNLQKPTYFRFLTLMAFHVFLEEKCNVAIVEVGVGGFQFFKL
jgi:folylpolyglutamate synthase